MAQTDGSIVIDTKLDTSGINNGAANMGSQMGKIADAADAAAQEIASSFSDIDVSGAADGMSESFSQESAEIEAILSNNEKSAKEKAESIAECYEEQGLSQSEAMKKAWEDIEENSKKSTDDVEKTTKSGSKKIKKHMDDIDDKSEGVGKNVANNLAGGISSAVKKIGSMVAAAFAVREIINFGKEAIELGSDLAEVQNVVDVTFTTLNEKVNEFAKSASATAGLSETMAKKYVGTFGAMSKSFGFTEEEALAMSTSLTQLSGDVASFYNLTNDEAYTKLKSVFTGETESLKDLGVVMSQTALDSYALAKGYKKTTKAMTEQEKVALRYEFVMDQLSGASGDFLRTSDGWANQVRVLKLNVESFMATIGQGLINLLTPAIKLLNSLFASLQKVAESFKEWTEQFVNNKDSVSEEIKDAASGAEDMATEMEDAADETKKIKQNLSGLDEIKIFDSGEDGVEDLENVVGSLGDISGTDVLGEAFTGGGKLSVDDIFDFDTFDWTLVGEKIGSAASTILSTATDLLGGVNWDGVGTALAKAVSSIPWKDVLVGVTELVCELGSGVIYMASGFVKELTVDFVNEQYSNNKKFSTVANALLVPEFMTDFDREAFLEMFPGYTQFAFGKGNVFDTMTVMTDMTLINDIYDAIMEFQKQTQIDSEREQGLVVDVPSYEDAVSDAIKDALGGRTQEEYIREQGLKSYEGVKAFSEAYGKLIELAFDREKFGINKEMYDKLVSEFWSYENASQAIGFVEYIFNSLEEAKQKALTLKPGDFDHWFDELIQSAVEAGRAVEIIGDKTTDGVLENTNKKLTLLPISAAQIGYDAGTKAGQNLSLGLDGQRGAVSASGKGLADSVLTDSVEVSLQGAMYQAGSNAGKQLAGALAGMVPLVKSSASDVMGGVSSGVETAANGNTVKSALERAMSAISSTIMTTFDNDMKNAGQKQAKKIGEKVGEAYAGGLGSTATSGIQSIVSNGLSKIGETLKDLTSIEVGGVKPFSFATSLLTKFNVPLLAKGAVIPPNAPFAAILGDQKKGTNVEAPLDTIKQAVRDVLGEGVQTGGNTYNVTATAKGRALFDLIITEGHDELVRTGKNPFAFAKA